MENHPLANTSGSGAKCPFGHGASKPVAGHDTSSRDWWPNQLKLNILRQQVVPFTPGRTDA